MLSTIHTVDKPVPWLPSLVGPRVSVTRRGAKLKGQFQLWYGRAALQSLCLAPRSRVRGVPVSTVQVPNSNSGGSMVHHPFTCTSRACSGARHDQGGHDKRFQSSGRYQQPCPFDGTDPRDAAIRRQSILERSTSLDFDAVAAGGSKRMALAE